jgi:hypothetical protein
VSIPRIIFAVSLFILGINLHPESFRTIVAGSVELSPDRLTGSTISMGINSSVLINLSAETRFYRGIEIEISAPREWLAYRGSIAMVMYSNLNRQSAAGITDFDGSRFAFEPLPSRMQTIYQVPLRSSHGLRTTTFVTVPSEPVSPGAFPILFRLMPVVKGISDELETMVFNITIKPILSDEGAVRINTRYPPMLRDRPFTLLIDDVLIENISEQLVLKEGEHHLVILSDNYRNESRRFIVERAKIFDLIIELKDPTPIIIFEGPGNASIYLNNVLIPRNREPISVEPGLHEAKFIVGDYTITKTINVLRGKTYRVALTIDLSVEESD